MVEYNEKYEYIKIEQTEEFKELKRRKYRFIFPVPLLFIVYYLFFIAMSAYAQDFMSQPLWGNLTIGYLFGVSYYLVVWALAFVYVIKARQYDKFVYEIVERYTDGVGDVLRVDIADVFRIICEVASIAVTLCVIYLDWIGTAGLDEFSAAGRSLAGFQSGLAVSVDYLS